MQFLNFVQFFLCLRRLSDGLIKAPQLVVGVGLGRIERYCAEKRRLRILIVFLLHVDCAQIGIDDAQILLHGQRSLQQRKRSLWMIGLPFDVPEVGQGLGMVGIESEFTLEFLPCFVIPLRLPEQVAEAEMNVGL